MLWFTLDEAICELCDECVKHSSNTTNLFTHLKRHHFIEHEEIVLATRKEQTESPEEHSHSTSVTKTRHQPSIVNLISRKEAYKKDSPRYLICQDTLVAYICNDLQPISVVNSLLFCQLLYTLNPRFQSYSRLQFSRIIILLKYDEVKQSVQEKLEKAKFISFTTDMWTVVIIMVTSPFLLILLLTGKCIITTYKHMKLYLLIQQKTFLKKYATPLMNGILLKRWL